MKKIAIGILLTIGIVAVVVALRHVTTLLPEPQEEAVLEPLEFGTKRARPATQAALDQKTPSPTPSPAPAVETAPSPLRVRFEAPERKLAREEIALVKLVVESVPEQWEMSEEPDAQLHLLLRLPIGVRLHTPDWTRTEEESDQAPNASGPWFLYSKELRLTLPEGLPPERLVEEEIALAIVQTGTNWIITARARLTRNESAWQTFAPLFATYRAGKGKFHTMPVLEFDLPVSPAMRRPDHSQAD